MSANSRRFKGGGRNPAVWKYITDIDNENRKATCSLCLSRLSFKSTSGNLSTHLRRRHNIFVNGEDESDHITHKDVDSKPAFSDRSDSDESTTLEPDNELWGFFDKEPKNRARCSMCGAILKRHSDVLYKHLKEQHSRISQNLEFKDNEESYTEVIYLEDPVADPEPKKPKYILKTEDAPKPKRPKRRHSYREPLKVSNHQEPVKKLDKREEEIDNFGKYITGLLKGVPRHACTKLQMDIVSLIMTSKLNITERTATITVDGTIEEQNEGDATIGSVAMDADQENESAEDSHQNTKDPNLDPGKDPGTPRSILKKPHVNPSYGGEMENLMEQDEKVVENFGNYITCLLQSVSNKEVGTKLQMDIVNLIMTTRLKCIEKCAPNFTLNGTIDNKNNFVET